MRFNINKENINNLIEQLEGIRSMVGRIEKEEALLYKDGTPKAILAHQNDFNALICANSNGSNKYIEKINVIFDIIDELENLLEDDLDNIKEYTRILKVKEEA